MRVLTDLLLLFPWTSTGWSVISAIKIRRVLGFHSAFDKSYTLPKRYIENKNVFTELQTLSSEPCLQNGKKNWELRFYTSYHKKTILHYLKFILISLLSLSIHMIFLVPLSLVLLFHGFETHVIFECTFKYQTYKYSPQLIPLQSHCLQEN